jgi:2,3-bisphosphoglycerate-independent phosphoglycerate mutase
VNVKTTRPRPVSIIALDAQRSQPFGAFPQHFARAQVGLDEVDAIDRHAIMANQVLRRVVRKAKDMGGRLHLIGLVSDGGVHSSLAHLFALIDVAREAGVRVVVHALLDGVDVPTSSAPRYIKELESKLEGGVGRIGTVSGRSWGMDCDGRWDRVEKVYSAIVAEGAQRADSALRGIADACAFGNTEGFISPFIAFDYPGVSLVDAALHFNVGAQHARELTQALAGPSFTRFVRKGGRAPFEGRYASMVPCDASLGLQTLFARAPDPSSLSLELAADYGCRLLQCSEGDATRIATDAERAIRSGAHDVVLADFASPDNTEGTGPEVAIDGAVQRILEAARSVDSAVLIIGGRDAANRVSLLYANGEDPQASLRDDGHFCDVAPTLFELLQLPQPADMDGRSLLVRSP